MGWTILVADDSASMRLSVRTLLEGWSARVVVREAIDGLDAIKKAEELNPDLILLDLAMPKLNGAEAASALKPAIPDTPIILFTLHTDLNGESISSAIGVDAFVSKADGISTLLERVNSLLPATSRQDTV
jgi:DNA-binding NarL/FixJ family response regulator